MLATARPSYFNYYSTAYPYLAYQGGVVTLSTVKFVLLLHDIWLRSRRAFGHMEMGSISY